MELHALTRELRMTSLFVTHDQEEAMTLSDVVAVMNKGVVEQFGTPDQIYRAPQTKFVADFMGITNFLPGKVVDVSGTLSRVEVFGAFFSVESKQKFNAGENVTLAVRPEKVAVSVEPPDSPAVKGHVKQVTYHGNTSRYVIELQSKVDLIAIEPNDEQKGTLQPGAALNQSTELAAISGKNRLYRRCRQRRWKMRHRTHLVHECAPQEKAGASGPTVLVKPWIEPMSTLARRSRLIRL